MTDEWDRRCLKSILSKYYTPQILSESYTFSPSGIYRAPPEGSLQSFRHYIEQLPLTDVPEVFGLHENADKTYQVRETSKLLSHLLSIQPKIALTKGKKLKFNKNQQLQLFTLPNIITGKSGDTIATELTKRILNGVPHVLNIEEHHESLMVPDEKGHVNSLSTVLSQEVDRYNHLLLEIRKSLLELEKALQGLVVMSETIEQLLHSVSRGHLIRT